MWRSPWRCGSRVYICATKLRRKASLSLESCRFFELLGGAVQVKLQISEICSLLDVDGIRGDIVTNRAVRAFVAFEGRNVVTMDDVKRVIGLCVNHRYAILTHSYWLFHYHVLKHLTLTAWDCTQRRQVLNLGAGCGRIRWRPSTVVSR